MEFAWIDVVILALIALSAILSLFRGFVREAVALATWLVALWVAMAFHEDLAAILSQWISTPSAQKITAFAVLFICVLLLGAIINFLASKLVDKTGLTGTDRLLGIVFGVARGGVIVGILVLLIPGGRIHNLLAILKNWPCGCAATCRMILQTISPMPSEFLPAPY